MSEVSISEWIARLADRDGTTALCLEPWQEEQLAAFERLSVSARAAGTGLRLMATTAPAPSPWRRRPMTMRELRRVGPGFEVRIPGMDLE